MQLIRKTLAFGQLPSSKGDLYVPDSGRKGFVHNVELHNANTSAETVVLNYHDGTSEHQVYKVSVDPDDTIQLDFRGEGSVVDDGAKITGSTTTATQVTYKLSGTEEIPDGVAGASGGGQLIWEWNGTDVTQFGDGDGTPTTTSNGSETGTLAAAVITGSSDDVQDSKALIYSHTGGSNVNVFYPINDLPVLPERFRLVAQMGPRGGSGAGANTFPAVLLAFQDSTHYFRLYANAGGTALQIIGGNGDIGSSTVYCLSSSFATDQSSDHGTILDIECMLTEPDTGVDPKMLWSVKAANSANVLNVAASSYSWSTFGGGLSPSVTWHSGWQSGGTVKQPGLFFRELGATGSAYFGMFKIYEV